MKNIINIFFGFLILFFFRCETQKEKLYLIPQEELLELIVKYEGRLDVGDNYIDQYGKPISKDSIISISKEYGLYYTIDFYKDEKGNLRKGKIRKSTANDSLFVIKVNQRINEPKDIKSIPINCDSITFILEKVYVFETEKKNSSKQLDRDSLKSWNISQVTSILDQCGMPTVQEHGKMALNTVWLVIQHSSYSYLKKFYPYFKQSVDKGDLERSALATMEDRILRMEGKPQIYGTQIDENKLYKTINIDSIDERRKEVGLGPIQDYLKGFGIELYD